MRPRVLQLLSCDDWGGTEVQVTRFVEHADPERSIQHVATLETAGVLTAELARIGVPVASLAGAFGPLGTVWRLVRILRRWQIDLVEVYGFRAGIIARPAVLLGGRPRLLVGIRGAHLVDGPPDARRARFALGIERLLSPMVTRYVANSVGARTLLRMHGFPARKLTVIPNGVELPVLRSDPTPGQPTRIVCVARFTPTKRHDVVIAALGLLRDRDLDVHFTLVGDGDVMAEARELVVSLGLTACVTFTGALPPERVAEELAKADVFVLASMTEGMPGSVLEAMAAGLPVVATDVAGTRELVEHERTGLLVRPGDARQLAEAIAWVAGDAALSQQLGAAGRQVVEEKYSVGRLAEQRTALYEDILRHSTRKQRE